MTHIEDQYCDWSKVLKAFPLVEIALDIGVTLRPLTASDAQVLATFMTGDAEMTWTRTVWKQENVDYLLSLRLKHYKKYGFGPYAVIIDGNLKGMAGVQVWEYAPCAIELLAYLAKDEWRRGFATNILKWVVKSAGDVGIETIYAATRAENERAIAVARRLQFREIGGGNHYGYPSIHWQLDLHAGRSGYSTKI